MRNETFYGDGSNKHGVLPYDILHSSSVVNFASVSHEALKHKRYM